MESETKTEVKLSESMEPPLKTETESSVRIEHGYSEMSWATRNGLTIESFKSHEDQANGTVELEREMKPRHLNMIAIGGRLVPCN